MTTDRTPPQAQMVMREHWQLRYVELCCHHGQPLIPLWQANAPLARYDLATQLPRLLPELLNGGQDRNTQPITTYDAWLDRRLSSGHESGWMSERDIDSAATFCNLLGAEMIRAFPDMETIEKPARAIGYDIANQGIETISHALNDLSVAASGPQDGMRQAFGRLYQWLAHASAHDQRCNIYRELLRDVILDTWEIPAGEVILGTAVQKRRRHSIQSASLETGKSVTVTRQILEHAGVIERGDPRPHKRLTFDAAQAEPTLKWCSRLVRTKEMAAHLGASSGQLDTLVREDLIKPAVPISVSKFQWDTADADELLRKLMANAKTAMDDGNWVSLSVAAGRARVSIRDAIRAVGEGMLDVAHLKDHHGYAGIHVRQSDIDKLTSGRPAFPTLAEFGMEVGLQKNGMMNALFEAGHVKATSLFNPATRRMGLYMTDEDQQAFHAVFTTLKLLSSSIGVEGRELKQQLFEADVAEFCLGDTEFERVYLLSDIQCSERRIDSLGLD